MGKPKVAPAINKRADGSGTEAGIAANESLPLSTTAMVYRLMMAVSLLKPW